MLGVLMAALLMVAWHPAAAAAEDYPDKPLVPARSARAFGDSVGVDVRMHLTNSAYGDFDLVVARLRELGVRYVGDGLCPTCETQLKRLEALGALGIKTNLGIGNQTDTALIEPRLQVVKKRLLGTVVSITGPNEVDISGDPNWVANTRAYQAALYNRIKGDPALAHLQVIGPSLVYRPSRAALGDISAYLDRGNIHPYPGGIPPMSDLALEHQLAAYVSGNKPLVATETGYHDDITYTGVHRGASERAIAIYTPRLMLEAFRDGIDRTYWFQLADVWSPTQAEQWGFPDNSNSFGLLSWTLAPKPAFYTLRNLMRVVDSDSPAVASPGGLRYSLDGAGPDVRQLLLRSADGSYELVLWRQVSVWDRAALKDLYPAADPLEVVFGEPVALAQRFDPVESDAERARFAGPRRIPVDLGSGPVVLRLTPPGVPAAGPPTRALKTRRLARTKARQPLRKFIVVKVKCAAPCARVTAQGRLGVRRPHRHRVKHFKLKLRKDTASNGYATLRLRIRPRARHAASKALKRGGRVWATITVVGHGRKGARLWTAHKHIVVVR